MKRSVVYLLELDLVPNLMLQKRVIKISDHDRCRCRWRSYPNPSVDLDLSLYETSLGRICFNCANHQSVGSKSVVKSKNISNLVPTKKLISCSFGTLFRRSLKNQPSNAIKVLEKWMITNYGKQP